MNTKAIPGWEGFYAVSDDGRVFSIDRTILRKNGYPMTVKAKELKAAEDMFGYRIVSLYRNGRGITSTVSRLMAKAFLSKPDVDFFEVDHINRNRSDDRLENLRWVSATANRLNGGTPRNNTSGKRGVYLDHQTGKWRSVIKLYGKNHSLGRFAVFDDACKARDLAESAFWREVE